MLQTNGGTRVFFLGLGEDAQRPSKGEKCTTKAIFGENFLWMLFHIILYLCDPHYALLYYQLYRYLVSLYQIIWTFTDPENGGFWKTYLDKEKMLVTSISPVTTMFSTLPKQNLIFVICNCFQFGHIKNFVI